MTGQPTAETRIVTANRLADGVVVFLTEGNRWTTDMQAAALATDPDTVRHLLARGERDAAAARVVGAYPIAVRLADGRYQPIELRERIRAEGLTFRTIAAESVSYF